MKKNHLFYGLAVAIIVILAAALWTVSHTDRMDVVENTPDTVQNGPQTDQSQQEVREYPVNVYFSRSPESDDDPSLVFPVERVAPDAGVAQFALHELIEGPTPAESDQGYSSQVKLQGESNCNEQDFTLAIENQTATVQFCRQLVLIGSISDAKAETQIKTTLTQFETIDEVIILNREGDCAFDLSGENRCLQ